MNIYEWIQSSNVANSINRVNLTLKIYCHKCLKTTTQPHGPYQSELTLIPWIAFSFLFLKLMSCMVSFQNYSIRLVRFCYILLFK